MRWKVKYAKLDNDLRFGRLSRIIFKAIDIFFSWQLYKLQETEVIFFQTNYDYSTIRQ